MIRDIIAKEGFESVSISGYSFDYSYLGSRKEYNTFLNFKNLALDIAKFLPRVLRNQGIRVLETGGAMKNFNYNSPDDYENEKLWLMQLTRPAQS